MKIKSTLETSQDQNYTRNERKATLETSEDQNYTRNERSCIQACSLGSAEYRVYQYVSSHPNLTQTTLQTSEALSKIFSVGFGTAMKLGWINVYKSSKIVSVSKTDVVDLVRQELERVKTSEVEGMKAQLEGLKKRKLVQFNKVTTYKVRPSSEVDMNYDCKFP